MPKFITVAVFTYPQEAYVVKSRLEAEEIPCFLKNELTIQSDNFLSNAIGGVQLQIPESFIEQSLPILEEFGLVSAEVAENTRAHYKAETNEEGAQVCPNCGSDNISIEKRAGSWFVGILLLVGIPLPIYSKKIHCFDCYTDSNLKK